jgi:hypothetical protein
VLWEWAEGNLYVTAPAKVKGKPRDGRLAAEVSVRAPETTVARWAPGGRIEY